MRISITAKITGIMIVGVVISCLTVLLLTTRFLNEPFQASLEASIRHTQSIVDERFQLTQAQYLQAVKLLVHDPGFTDAVVSGDSRQLAALCKTLMADTGADFLTVTDAEGVVLARGHSDKLGDNAGKLETVRRSRNGEVSVGVVTGGEVPLAFRAATPLLRDGKLVGTVSLGTSLTNERYVDELKRTTGLEVTFFQGDTRVMSSIMEKGRRIIGTRISEPAVSETVLGRGGVFFADTQILGRPYKAAYWPIKDIGGAIVGMYFVGAPLEETLNVQKKALIKALLGAAGVALLLVGLSVYFGMRISRPVKKTTEYAVRVAEGHLDAELHVATRDEVETLAHALRDMVDNLKKRIAEAREQSDIAAEETRKAQTAARQAEEARQQADVAKREGMEQAARELKDIVTTISEASENLSQRIQQTLQGAAIQSRRTRETVAAMEEMNGAVLDAARSAESAARTSEEARSNAENGADIVVQLARDIESLRNQAAQLDSGMTQLGSKAESIGQIVQTIADIADQTNLLALNAAIEAARAGEAGRGFAVVADEVRKLAEKTMTATRDVEDSVAGIQQDTQLNIAQLMDTLRCVESAFSRAGLAESALREIVGLSENTATQVRSIATAGEEQSTSSESIRTAIEEVDQISEEGSEAMRQSAAAVDALVHQTQALSALIRQLSQ